MNVKCLSVRLNGLTKISEKAYKAKAFDGSSAIIPASQIFGQDNEVSKSNAYWIAEWVLKDKQIQYSHKKTAWFDSDTRKRIPDFVIINHIPLEIKEKEVQPNKELIKDGFT
jgi:hypothetical protein